MNSVTKTIIDPDVGQGFAYFGGSGVGELIHSAGVVIETDQMKIVYCSGKTATFDQGQDSKDRDTIVAPGDIKEQTRQVLRNLQTVLASAGATIDDIVRMRVYVVQPFSKEMFGKVHEARAEFFKKEHYPASTLVVVHALARPEALIEIDADAVVVKTAG